MHKMVVSKELENNKIRIEDDFKKTIIDIKEEIKSTQIKSIQQVNSNLIKMYFRIGKILEENSKYGNSFIKRVAHSIKIEYPNITGFSERNLRSMKLFYNEYKDNEKWQQLVANLPWGHNVLLMEKVKDKNIRMIYVKAVLENGWSRSILELQIESNYHLRVGNTINNFDMVLSSTDSDLVNNTLKDPYIFDFLSLNNDFKEKELEDNLIMKIKDLLLELGNGFSFVGNQYKLTIDGTDYFIDLLFYHLKLKCYIIVELKVSEFKPEYVGKMNFYLSAVDDLIKDKSDNPSIGLILCKGKNRFTAKYALKDINKPIGVSSFKLSKYLPSEEDLNLYMDIKDE